MVYIILSSLSFRAAAVLRPSWSVRFQARFISLAQPRHVRETPPSARQNERSAQAASERTQGARQAGAAAHGSSAGMQTGYSAGAAKSGRCQFLRTPSRRFCRDSSGDRIYVSRYFVVSYFRSNARSITRRRQLTSPRSSPSDSAQARSVGVGRTIDRPAHASPLGTHQRVFT